MVMEAVVGGVGWDGSPFLLDPESVPRVVSLSSRSSILPRYQAAEERCSSTARTQGVKTCAFFPQIMSRNHVSQVSPHPDPRCRAETLSGLPSSRLLGGWRSPSVCEQ